MRKLIWKIVYKVICGWCKVTEKNGIREQVHDCKAIMHHLELYKCKAKRKGIW